MMNWLVLAMLFFVACASHSTIADGTAKAVEPNKQKQAQDKAVAKAVEKKTTQPFDIDKLEEKYQNAKSFQADFRQEAFQITRARTKSSRGRLMMRKPHLIRWETHEPNKNVLVTNGDRLWHYTPALSKSGKGQVKIQPAKQIRDHQLVKILSGSSKLKASFVIKKEKLSDGKVLLLLTPKRRLGELKLLKLKVNPETHLIREARMEYASGNHTTIYLQNISLSDNLPASLFDFTPPAGTEIIKQ